MYNTKSLLREEINLNNKKMLLSEESIALIQNSEYIKNVLGIKLPLTEYYSIELRKQIIQEKPTPLESHSKLIKIRLLQVDHKIYTFVSWAQMEIQLLMQALFLREKTAKRSLQIE